MVNLKLLLLATFLSIGIGNPPTCYGQANIHLDPTTLRNGCPGEAVTLQCTTFGSSILAWRSEEYIGPGNDQLEFGGSLNHVGDTMNSTHYPTTVAKLTGAQLHQDNNLELTSTLQIALSTEAIRTSVTCVHVDSDETMVITLNLLDEARALSGVKSVLRREPNNMCAVDLVWELPEDFIEEEDISHFTVTINDEETNVVVQPSTSYTRCFCEPHNVTITLIDRCGRIGSTTSVITLNTTQPLFDQCEASTSNVTTTTATTTTPSPTRNDQSKIGFIVGIAVLSVIAAMSICGNIFTILHYMYKKHKKDGYIFTPKSPSTATFALPSRPTSASSEKADKKLKELPDPATK